MQNNSTSILATSRVTPRQQVIKTLASTALRSGLLLVGLIGISAVAPNAHAATESFDYVNDVIGNSSISGCSGSGDCALSSVTPPANSDRADLKITAWDDPVPSTNSVIYAGRSVNGTLDYVTSQSGLSGSESEFSRTIYYASPSTVSTLVGWYSNNKPSGTSGNLYIKRRNYRVKYYSGTGRVSPFKGPEQVEYTNISNNSTILSLPSVAGSVAFQGTAKPDFDNKTLYPISYVYLSLENPNGLYWGGNSLKWINRRINHAASISVINTTTKEVQWTKVGDWPTGTDLPNGVYTLRTMARSGTNPGPGKLNTISFTVGTTPTPTATPTPSPDTTSPNPATVTTPSQSSTVAVLTSIGGNCSDNVGGSGVASVQVQLTYEAVAGGVQDWDWVAQNWVPYGTNVNSRKAATVSGNTWSLSSGLPPASKQYGGLYTVRMFTKDVAGNPESYGTGAVNITQDPSVVTTPSNNSTISTLPTISGVCDPGATIVRVILSRGGSYSTQTESWNWVTQSWVPYYSTTDVYKIATINNGTFSVTSGLPSGTALANGYHNIDTRTTDRMNGDLGAHSSFTVSKFGVFSAPSGGGS